MSDLLRMTGMYSGMDTESIVSQLVKTKSTKVTNLKNEQKKLEWKQTAWQDLNSKIYNMYSKTLSNLRLTSAYSKKSTVSSDSTKATVVASEGAVNGTQTLQVNKLAKSGYLTGAKLDGKTTTTTGTDGKDVTKVVNWETTDKLSEIDSNLTGKTISLTTGTGTDAKTTDIEITADMTINDLVAKFKDAGVNASFDTTNQRFFINSTGTGSNGSRMEVPQAKDAMDKFKMEVAGELGVNLKSGYNGDLTSAEAGSIGGEMVRQMIRRQEEQMSGQK